MTTEPTQDPHAMIALTPDERRVCEWLSRELARTGLRQITAVEVRLLRGGQVGHWDRATHAAMFESEGRQLAIAIVQVCADNVAGANGETFAISAISVIGGATARSTMRLRVDGEHEHVEPPTMVGALEQMIRHNEVLLHATLRGASATNDVLAQMNERLLARVTDLEEKRQKQLEEREQLETLRHERQAQLQHAAAVDARRTEMARKLVRDFLPLVMAKISGGAVPGAHSAREKVLDALLHSIAADDARLAQLGALLKPTELAMLVELGKGIQPDDEQGATPTPSVAEPSMTPRAKQ